MLLSTEPTTKKGATAAFDGTFKIFYIFVGINMILEKSQILLPWNPRLLAPKDTCLPSVFLYLYLESYF